MTTSPWSLPVRALALLGWFTKQFIVTSVQVSALILTPGRQPQPGIVRVDLDEMSDAELTLLIAIITITPDTLVIAVDRRARAMFVHGMFVAGDPEAFRSSLLDTQARLVRGVRWRAPASHAREDTP
ncbi:Na+/H+ antiporter subunit E [Microcella sp.]|uniref:Na+/H+ antiporter subunit E n=1 Tax=Microcella sp. TaxID=1913979 RepID=UPI002560580A|nr:Na+/H+ antiporter subunit E [Microcella sp.]MBX9470902.1 Na+/H+ antiporter subunit E [Microcella sp.]